MKEKKPAVSSRVLLAKGLKLALQALKQLEQPPPPVEVTSAYQASIWTITITAACSGDCPRCYAIGLACTDRRPHDDK